MGDYFYTIANGHGLRRNPLKAIIAPRPVGWISSCSKDGSINLAPYSFFNMINDTPPLLMFASTGYKDSVRNIEETGEFVVNMASRALAEQMNITSADYPPDSNEFIEAQLAALPSHLVKAPRVAASPAALECRVASVSRLRDSIGILVDAWMVVGEIIAVHIDDACIVDNMFRTELAHPILRAGYADEYWEIGEQGKFLMRR